MDTPSICYISGHGGGHIQNEAGEYEWVIELFQYVQKVDHMWFVGINWYSCQCIVSKNYIDSMLSAARKRELGLESLLLIKTAQAHMLFTNLGSKTYQSLSVIAFWVSQLASVPCVLTTAAFLSGNKCIPQHSQNTFLHFSGLLLRRDIYCCVYILCVSMTLLNISFCSIYYILSPDTWITSLVFYNNYMKCIYV